MLVMFQNMQETKEIVVHMDAIPRVGEYILITGVRSDMPRIEGRIVSIIWSLIDQNMNYQCSAIAKARVVEKFDQSGVETPLTTQKMTFDEVVDVLQGDARRLRQLIDSGNFDMILSFPADQKE